MATPVTVMVAQIENLRPHPSADRLEICDVLGWQMVIPKGIYANGMKIVYFPPDTLIPRHWADRFGVTKYLRGKENDRVGKVRLRNEPSFGLATALPDGQDWPLGTNVAEFFAATKYEPPIRASAGDAETPHPLFDRYTDIENLRNYPAAFEVGEEIIATEKIHGTNCRVGLVEGEEMAGSMSIRRKRPSDEEIDRNTYWFPWTLPGVRNLLHGIAARRSARQVILFGETYGGSIQSLSYGVAKGRGFGFAAFDLLVDGRYVNHDELSAMCQEFGVAAVPVLYRGPFGIAAIRDVADGPTALGDATHIREGVVVRPAQERMHPALGRLVMKYIGDQYLLGDETDAKDV